MTSLNRKPPNPVIEFIAQGAAPVPVENTTVASAVHGAHGLAVGIEPVDYGAAGEAQGDPVRTGH